MENLLGLRFLSDVPLAGSITVEFYHDPGLVTLSFLIACISAYTALHLAAQIPEARGFRRPAWYALCAMAMGGGIWAMHFMGMLAMLAPVAIAYDWSVTVLSLAVAVVGALLAVLVNSREPPRIGRVLGAGVLMGLAIVCMHYTGMAAIRSEVSVAYSGPLFSLSILVAMVAATAALAMTHFVIQAAPRYALVMKLGAALVMGLAITGMHFTGKAATVLYATATPVAPMDLGANLPVALAVFAVTMIVLGIAMLAAVLGRQLDEEEIRFEHTVFRYDQILESVPDGILVVDPELHIQHCNRAARRMFELRDDPTQPVNIRALLPRIDECVENSTRSREQFIELDAHSELGRDFPLEMSISRVIDDGIDLLVMVCRDISARRRVEGHVRKLLEENKRLAATDTLTGLPNRRFLMDAIVKELNRCQRYGHDLSILIADIDFFKRINDTHGHAVGDGALKVMSGVLRHIARASDLLCRFGGEEFLIALPETDIRHARVVADRLREHTEQTEIELEGGRTLRMTCSIGVAQWQPGSPIDDAIAAADNALYTAKENGRNRVVVADGTVKVPRRRSTDIDPGEVTDHPKVLPFGKPGPDQ